MDLCLNPIFGRREMLDMLLEQLFSNNLLAFQTTNREFDCICNHRVDLETANFVVRLLATWSL